MLKLIMNIPLHQLHFISVLISHRDHAHNLSVKHTLQQQFNCYQPRYSLYWDLNASFLYTGKQEKRTKAVLPMF